MIPSQTSMESTSTAPEPMSLRAHIEAETAAARREAGDPSSTPDATSTPAVPVVEAPPATEPVAAVAPTAEAAAAEADSLTPDTEVSEAARVLRRNRADERKAKIQREIDDLVRTRNAERAELERLRQERQAAAQPVPEVPPDPSDPEPTLERFTAAHPDHADPYAGWQRELARWDRRQDAKQADAARQRQQAETALATALQGFTERAKPLRESHADFDAVVNDLSLTPAMQAAIFESERGPELAYYLATHQTAYREILTAPPTRALYLLGRLEATITAPPTVAPKPVTKAPPVPAQTVGGAAAATEPDSTKVTSLRDHIRIERAKELEARRLGLRY